MTHTFFLDNDNEQALELRLNGVNLSLAQYDAIDRITIELQPTSPARGEAVLLDSSVTAGLLSWGTAGAGQRVLIEGRHLSSVPVEVGNYRARLVAYSTEQPTGLVFADFTDYQVKILS